jgi:hypothetical protein
MPSTVFSTSLPSPSPDARNSPPSPARDHGREPGQSGTTDRQRRAHIAWLCAGSRPGWRTGTLVPFLRHHLHPRAGSLRRTGWSARTG